MALHAMIIRVAWMRCTIGGMGHLGEELEQTATLSNHNLECLSHIIAFLRIHSDEISIDSFCIEQCINEAINVEMELHGCKIDGHELDWSIHRWSHSNGVAPPQTQQKVHLNWPPIKSFL